MSGFRYTDAGTVTVEGSVAGDKAAFLAKKREERAAQFEAKKAELEARRRAAASALSSAGFVSEIHTEGDADTVYGLQTKEQREAARRARAEEAVGLPLQEAAKPQPVVPPQAAASASSSSAPEQPKKRAAAPSLSFNRDEDDEDEDEEDIMAQAPAAGPAAGASKRVKLPSRDPSADTWFLSNPEREAKAATERARLEEEWEAQQERTKKEKIEVVYSYWDGTGHRRRITVPKGATIGRFLEWVRQDLVKSFPELRTASSSDLMYVKEDLIIPQALSFYDLIVTRARGKSGPLFRFAAEEELRMVDDVRVEREDSHPGKVVQRSWYEKNKHVFPASRWEPFDPATKRDTLYSVRGS